MAPTPVLWNLSEKGVNYGIYWAAKKLDFSIDRPGMDRRTYSKALDDKIMGDVATLAVLAYLHNIGVPAIAYDQIRTDNFQKPDPGWDIAIGPNAKEWAKTTTDPTYAEGLTTISIKSSRLPKTDSLLDAINSRDFKIFQYRDSIREDLTTDLEVQVYYDYYSSWIGNLGLTDEDDEENKEYVRNIAASPSFRSELTQPIATKLDVQNRWGNCNLVGYNDKESMVAYSTRIRPQIWRNFEKPMWIAPLRFGKNMIDLKGFVDREI